LKDDACSVLVAATDTAGNAMTVNNQAIYERLVSELEIQFPDRHADLPFVELEKLPYSTAVIKEGLRL
jgi:hypothetical protein